MSSWSQVGGGSSAPADGWSPTSNPKWLSLRGDGKERLRLPDDTSLAALEAHIKAAMRSGDALMIELQPDEHATDRRVILNGSALGFVVLLESVEDAPKL
jgi:hypothetical protein